MVDVMDAAKYVAGTYESMFSEPISEMKLHKLLYFAQRESLAQRNAPLFDAIFQGWKYGHVLPVVRRRFDEALYGVCSPVGEEDRLIMDYVVRHYGAKDAWSLSRLSHGEYSWKKSREGIGEYERGNRDIPLDDIRVDARSLRARRFMLQSCRQPSSGMA